MAWLTGRYERLFYRSIYYTKHFWIAKVCWTLFDRLVGKQQGINTTTNDSCLTWPATTKTTTAFFVVSYPVFILNLFKARLHFVGAHDPPKKCPFGPSPCFTHLNIFWWTPSESKVSINSRARASFGCFAQQDKRPRPSATHPPSLHVVVRRLYIVLHTMTTTGKTCLRSLPSVPVVQVPKN